MNTELLKKKKVSLSYIQNLFIFLPLLIPSYQYELQALLDWRGPHLTSPRVQQQY